MDALRERASLIHAWPPAEITSLKPTLPAQDYGLVYAVYADLKLSHSWRDVQIHNLGSDCRPLLSGIGGVSGGTGNSIATSRSYVWPIAKDAKVTLNEFTSLFSLIHTRVSTEVKSILLAICDADSTVVYYLLHEGIVKPNPN